MKLAKISLATMVALGAFSSVASATPLEEAIKNVDVSGMARYRYDSIKTKASGEQGSKTNSHHTFRIKTNFKAAIDDNFFGVLGLRYQSRDTSGNNGLDKTDADKHFGVYQLYLGYKAGNTTVTAGKQEVGTFFTDDEVGTGIRIVNQDIEGLTLAAVAFDALDYDTYEADGQLLDIANDKSEKDTVTKITKTVISKDISYKPGNLYGVAAIGSYDPVGFQLWYASLDKVADLLAVELTGKFNVADDVAIRAKAQYVHSDADSKAEKTFDTLGINYTDGNFYAGQLGTDLFGVALDGGYVGFKAKDYGATSYVFEDEGKLIAPGERLVSDKIDYSLAEGKGSFWFVKAGYTFDKFFVGGDYAKGNVKTKDAASGDIEKVKYDEWVARLGYKYSKKLNFTSWYSHITEKDGGDKDKRDYFRFQTVYSF
ncbi:major outer membrane protein [Campylobacter suis]|uniref:Major outer membrane protein n=1 Tax=Campylobacter suis TaxID=2790657 RepID=A0ABM8Q1F7_9BACT|nr:major outer membrane protein [Campylobacter suis]CAD7286651.1 Major outer membrane protein [Campylobacter suis]